MATLVRESLVMPDVSDARLQLATKAEKLLAYRTLSESLRVAGELGKVLHELGIEPFSPASVEAYMEEAQAKANRERSWWSRMMDLNFYWGTVGLFWRYDGKPHPQYRKPIPEFVLNKAVQIAERLPAAQFYVVELTNEVRLADPFLKVELGRESYYIEVWDEPKFENKL